MRFFLKIAYKGTQYCGWQVQPNADTVQARINDALRMILRAETIDTIGCGRTDTGVHAREFYLHFDHSHIEDKEKTLYQLNSVLPADIAVHAVHEMHDGAHARFDALCREYEYHVHFQKDPFVYGQSVYLPFRPDYNLMNRAAEELQGEKDFTSFAKLHGDSVTNICNILSAQWEPSTGGYVFRISANRFLRNMVRAIVGTQLMVGKGELSVEGFREIIKGKNRSLAGMSVAPEGLFLTKITYPYQLV